MNQVTQLHEDEQVLTASRAQRATKGGNADGQLVLTSHRLLFVPEKKGLDDEVVVNLHEIKTVTLANRLFLIPSGICVRLVGREERFIVPKREQWQQLIVMATQGELQAQLAELEAQGAEGVERPVVVVPGGGQTAPIEKVVSWPAVAAWIAVPFAFVPLFGLLPAIFVLVCSILLLRGQLKHDRAVGKISLGLSGFAFLFFGVGFVSLIFQGQFPEFPESGRSEISLATRVMQIAVLVMSVVLHEVGHGLSAYWAGDLTALKAGRLKLNPIPHIDLFGSIILPAILVISNSPAVLGWAKPVPVNPSLFRKRRLGNLAVSLAGVSANMLVAMVALSLLATLGSVLHFVYPDMVSTGFWMAGSQAQLAGIPAAEAFAITAEVLKTAVLINLVLFAFNLLPVPPLDGSHVLELVLPQSLARLYAKLRPFGMIILVVLIVANILDYLFIGVAIVMAILGSMAGAICGLG